MSDSSEKDEKTEEASEKKIQDALEKGQTPVSKEVSIFFTLITVLFLMAFFITDRGKEVTHGLSDLLGHAGEISLN
ncbi:MAG: EscU/YscU/HrcU family type III secretion system export apparatus switch protein, partial [Pseudomonadota bacterium]